MRTLERLLDVLPTVNPKLYPAEAGLFAFIASCLKKQRELPDSEYQMLRAICRQHASPYICDLADDTWYWVARESRQ